MRRTLLSLTAAAAVLTVGAGLPSKASATPLSAPSGLQHLFHGMNPVQDVAICFYIDGWNGPGLYDCGFRHRRGYGWHGRRDERRGDRDRHRDHDRDHRRDRD
jgi:hypothetical protein